MNTTIVFTVISTSILSILICLILFYGNSFEMHNRTNRSKLYSLLVLCNILALVSDMLSWIFEGNTNLLILLYVFTAISIVISFILFGIFILYIYAYIGERRKMAVFPFRLFLIACCIATVLSTIGCCTNKLFYYINGVYTTGPLYTVYVLANAVLMIGSVVVIAFCHKELGLHDSLAAYLYILFPVIGAILNMYIPNYSFTYTATSISLLELYIMIQSEHFGKLEKEKDISKFYANHDDLTGISSRRAYVENLAAIIKANPHIGIMFFDLNYLKYTNDTLGHAAGDQLLINFVNILLKNCKKENIYRISGDEFIVLFPSIDKSIFEQSITTITDSMEVNGRLIACMGHSYGSGCNISELQQNAEAMMYVSKDAFHKAHPDLSR